MTEDRAYARAGVDEGAAARAVGSLVEALGSAGAESEDQAVPAGHYASVVRLDSKTGIALAIDGVGTKLLVAERLGRWDTVGIDCVAMNVNDVICVGAKPVAMLDYLAVESADERVAREIGEGLRRGAELAGIAIPGGELAIVPDLVRGLDLAGACIGTVRLDGIVTGATVKPGDAVIGLPSSGLHSNGYSLARAALADLPLSDERLGRPLGEVLLEPTTIYVAAVLDLLRSPLEVRGLAHITGGGLANLTRLEADCGYAIEAPLSAPPVFELIADLGGISEEEMRDVFNMGCGFCCIVAADDAEEATSLLRRHHPGAEVIGSAIEGPRRIEVGGA